MFKLVGGFFNIPAIKKSYRQKVFDRLFVMWLCIIAMAINHFLFPLAITYAYTATGLWLAFTAIVTLAAKEDNFMWFLLCLVGGFGLVLVALASYTLTSAILPHLLTAIMYEFRPRG